MTRISYKRHRFPAAVIQHAVWLYFRFTLSLRDVEELLAQRGIGGCWQVKSVSQAAMRSSEPHEFPQECTEMQGLEPCTWFGMCAGRGAILPVQGTAL